MVLCDVHAACLLVYLSVSVNSCYYISNALTTLYKTWYVHCQQRL
jgi:hypothetical protein